MDEQDDSDPEQPTLDMVHRLFAEHHERHDIQVALVGRLLANGKGITEAMQELVAIERSLDQIRQQLSALSFMEPRR